jgi:hypothetical protein
VILSCTFFWMWSALWFLSSSVSFFRGRVFTSDVSFCPLSIGGLFYERLICSLVPVSSFSSVSLIHIVERILEMWHLSLQCVVWCVLWIVELAWIIDYLQCRTFQLSPLVPEFASCCGLTWWFKDQNRTCKCYISKSFNFWKNLKQSHPSFYVPQSRFDSITRPVGWPRVQILFGKFTHIAHQNPRSSLPLFPNCHICLDFCKLQHNAQ